jgi:hypothetical protein
MPEDKLHTDFNTHLKAIQDTKDWLGTLYYHPEFGQFFQRPVVSLLITACEYLLVNLREMSERWRLR